MHALAKILARHSHRSEVQPGEIVQASPDAVMMHDRGVARATQRFFEMGGKRVWDPDKVVVVFDHFYPPPRPQDAEGQRLARDFMDQQGITHFHAGEGIAHVVLPEKGYAFPGALVVGTDSHTITNSALGCFAMGLGHSDIGSILAIGSTWLRVPEVVRFDIHGELQPGVEAKDVMLEILRLHGEDACVYQGVEYAGPTIRSMGMDGRLTLCNMAVEIGGKSGYVQPDDITWRWMEGRRDRAACDPQTTDSASDYAAVIDVDVSALTPLVAVPHNLSHIEQAGQLAGVRIDEAVLGTCTNGRIEDFRAAAAMLKGKKVAKHVRMVVNPGSLDVYRQAMREGLIDILIDAGAVIGTPGCGPCGGCQLGMLAPGEVAISSSSRNFKGRMGSPESGLYVASAATVAASAVEGSIVDPSKRSRKDMPS
jgi:3-isopropylmalate/(R)-2-methylmalate dehydratase large subunit